MSVRVGINGFGRIGRNFFRSARGRGENVEVVAVNDLGDAETMAHLLKYDSVLGPLDADVHAAEGAIAVDEERDQAPQRARPVGASVGKPRGGRRPGVHGPFHQRDQAQKHLDAGAPRVVISAPATDPDVTLVLGVNDEAYDPERDRIISNASCTTTASRRSRRCSTTRGASNRAS